MKYLVILLTALMIQSLVGCSKRYVLSDGHTLHVEEEVMWEINQTLYYKVTKDGKTVIPTTRFGISSDGDFQQVAMKDGIFAFAQAGRPNDVVVMFDTRSQESWPYQLPNEGGSEPWTRGENMLRKLGSETLSLNRE